MRRRVRETGAGAPPLPLTRYHGSSNREAFAWIRARSTWWNETHGFEAVGDIQWVIDGYAQVGDMHFCGSIGASCGDDDCLCTLDQEAET